MSCCPQSLDQEISMQARSSPGLSLPNTANLYFDGTNLQLSVAGGPYQPVQAGVVSTTLQNAYNGGNTISIASGTPVQISDTTNGNGNVVEISKSPGAGTTGSVLALTMNVNATGPALLVTDNATASSVSARLAGDNHSVGLEFANGQNLTVSNASEGRLRYNNNTSAFEVSINGGAYTALDTAAGASLQIAYNAGATIATSGGTAIAFSDTNNDAANVLTVSKSPSALQGGSAVALTTGANGSDPTLLITNNQTVSSPAAVNIRLAGTNHSVGVEFTDGQFLGLSNASEGRIRYNNATHNFEISTNGGAYTAITTGGTVTLQSAYNGGQTIATTGGTAIAFSDTNADDGNVLTIAKSPGSSHAGAGISITMNANTTAAGLVVNQNGSGVSATFNTKAPSAPGAGSTSEQWGSGAAVASGATNGTALGNAATIAANKTACTVLGQNATITTNAGSNCMALGSGATCNGGSGGSSVAVGNGATSQADTQVVVGASATGSSGSSHTVVIGNGAAGGGSGADSVCIGAGASSYGTDVVIGRSASASGSSGACVIIGWTATAAISNCVIIGFQASANASSQNSTVVGRAATATSTNACIIGINGAVSADRGIAIGNTATVSGAQGIAIGANATDAHSGVAIGRAAATTTSAQVVFGSSSYQLTDLYLGKGVSDAAPVTVVVHGTGGTGAGIAGGALTLAAGVSGDGSTNSGAVNLQVAVTGSSTTLSTLLAVNPAGPAVTIGGSANYTGDALTIDYRGTGTTNAIARIIVGAAKTLSANTKGLLIDLSNNVTPAGFSVTAESILLPINHSPSTTTGISISRTGTLASLANWTGKLIDLQNTPAFVAATSITENGVLANINHAPTVADTSGTDTTIGLAVAMTPSIASAGTIGIQVTIGSNNTKQGIVVTQNGTGAAINIAAQSAPTTSQTNGDIWTDSTQQALGVYQSGITQFAVGVIATQTAVQTIANSAAETTLFGTLVGTKTLPANFFVVGKTVRISMAGIYSASTQSATVKFKVGSVTVVTTSIPANGSQTNQAWRADLVLTCQTTGVSGTFAGSGVFSMTQGSAIALAGFTASATSLADIDTTASEAIDVTWTWGGASSSDTITTTTAVIEVLN